MYESSNSVCAQINKKFALCMKPFALETVPQQE
jgi:hypothetical protein